LGKNFASIFIILILILAILIAAIVLALIFVKPKRAAEEKKEPEPEASGLIKAEVERQGEPSMKTNTIDAMNTPDDIPGGAPEYIQPDMTPPTTTTMPDPTNPTDVSHILAPTTKGGSKGSAPKLLLEASLEETHELGDRLEELEEQKRLGRITEDEYQRQKNLLELEEGFDGVQIGDANPNGGDEIPELSSFSD